MFVISCYEASTYLSYVRLFCSWDMLVCILWKEKIYLDFGCFEINGSVRFCLCSRIFVFWNA